MRPRLRGSGELRVPDAGIRAFPRRGRTGRGGVRWSGIHGNQQLTHMPRKSLIEEFLSAGVGLLDDLFGTEPASPASGAVRPPQPTMPSLPTPVRSEMGQRLRQIDWYQFEKLVAVLYEEKGYRVERRGGAHPDGGVDLVIRPQRGGNSIIVQCKHWKARHVGEPVIRELLGSQKVECATRAILITLRGYHPGARAMAQQQQVELLEEAQIVDWIESHRGRTSWPRIEACLNSREKRCPRCESPMVERTVRKGPRKGERIWGCAAFPRCRYLFDVETDDEPGGAPTATLQEAPAGSGYQTAERAVGARKGGEDLRAPSAASAAATRGAAPATSPASSRICPRCGSPLVEREARKGANAGNRFLGCSTFPKCRYIGSV